MGPIRIAAALMFLAATTAQAQPAPVRAEGAWARATPPRAEAGAVYLTLVAPVADQLMAVSSPAAATAVVHEMAMDAGVMRMREVASLALPAGQSVALKPGGFHVMLMGLKAPLREGQSVPLRLTFASAPPLDVVAVVGPIGASGPAVH